MAGNYPGPGAEHSTPGGAYDSYSYAIGNASPDNTQQVRALWLTAAIAGLILYGISFGSRIPLESTLWPAILASAISAIGLAPRQHRHAWIVVSLATTGFAMALGTWIRTDNAGWALTTVVVLTALQAIVAAAALVLDREPAQETSLESDYAAYTRYVQAYQTYTQQHQPQPAPQQMAEGQATANAYGAATSYADNSMTAQTRQIARIPGQMADSSQESYAAVQDRYSQHSPYPAPQPHPQQQPASPGMPAASATADPGIPNYARGGSPAGHQQTQATGHDQASSP
ncbi:MULTISPECIES: DUF5336 domain-containing protein [Mycolicibacterium]|uniref:DUF5336 domain-containing protein n=1 Tax=Mycolicibacterium TaxID=1866885 RepID=UPI001CDB69A7|nr:DUF5336 domain-containing protein [Mycolicibacterium fortuitum]UBV23943.1 hypothetical protein H8Z59_12910 [Mycolicibacterium fortuitum]